MIEVPCDAVIVTDDRLDAELREAVSIVDIPQPHHVRHDDVLVGD